MHDGWRRHEIDLRRAAHERVARQIGIQEAHTEKLPRKVPNRLHRAHAVPVWPPHIFHLRLRGLIIHREDHIPPNHPLHIAPIPSFVTSTPFFRAKTVFPSINASLEPSRSFSRTIAISTLFAKNAVWSSRAVC